MGRKEAAERARAKKREYMRRYREQEMPNNIGDGTDDDASPSNTRRRAISAEAGNSTAVRASLVFAPGVEGPSTSTFAPGIEGPSTSRAGIPATTAAPIIATTNRPVTPIIHQQENQTFQIVPVQQRSGVERVRQHRESLTPEEAQNVRINHALQEHQRRLQFTPEQTAEIRANQAARYQQRRLQRNPEHAAEIRADQSGREQRRRSQLQQVPEFRVANADRMRQIRQRQAQTAMEQLQVLYNQFIRDGEPVVANQSPRFNTTILIEHSCGPFTDVCEYCGARHFRIERPSDGRYTVCCRKGRLQLPNPTNEYPDWLRRAMTDPNDHFYANFRSNIRNFNSSLSFASLGANINLPPGRGPYCFRINGMTYHQMPTLQAAANNNERYAQLYFLDSATQAVNIRMQHGANQNLNPALLRQILDYLGQNNHYARMFHSTIDKLREAEAAGHNMDQVGLVFNRDYRQPGIHPGRQNETVSSNEVAAVFVMENEGVPSFNRDFVVYARNPNARYDVPLHPQSPHLDPCTYVLLFPHGEPGWQINWRCNPYPNAINLRDRRISLLQLKAALLQVRDNPWRPILHAGDLTQQWIVDSYLQVESNNLEYIRKHQDDIRANAYNTLNTYVTNQAREQGAVAAPSIILPSTFTGSARYMRQLSLDAMAIFGRFGAPDLFITFTCNPKWTETEENLLQGEAAHDRPDLVARAFKIKLNALLKDITGGLFGPVVAYVYTIEFQKRGLPHAHILMTLQDGNKPIDPQSIDKIVCAEIPDREANPRLFDIVTRTMIHGPCSNTLCLDDQGRCKKDYPKPVSETTTMVRNSFPTYRRRALGHIELNRGRRTSNGFVVPYNAYLVLKYNAHINVEVCSNMPAAIKYLYKYIFKGFDVASLTFTRNGQLISDEVRNYISCRYVSAPEAVWRLFEFNTHDRSHAVYRLPVHTEQPRTIHFEDGFDDLPEREEDTARTMLNAFFDLNSSLNTTSGRYLYTEIPEHYVYNSAQRNWIPRQRGGNKIVTRMRDVNPNRREEFALRVLLLHIRGPTSFEAIRNINGIQYGRYLEAAQALNIIRNDDVFYATFDDLRPLRMAHQLRHLFAIMLLNYIITTGPVFWDRYKNYMIEDFQRMPRLQNATIDMLYNLALHHINEIFMRQGRTNETFGLPMPDRNTPNLDPSPLPVAIPSQAATIQLNRAQKRGFDKIMGAARGHQQQKCFIVIGPGGSGKTTLYKQIMATCRAENLQARAYATTGIAATLMEGGLTVHRGFGIPITLNPHSRSNFNDRELPQCQSLVTAHVILIDEITMMVKDAFRIIDQLLRELMDTDLLFGGKVIIVGGDFRQLLPVVPRATIPEIIETSVISSPLWRNFEVIHLTENMRVQDNSEFSKWLLDLGTGQLPSIDGINDQTLVEIPQDILLQIPHQTAPIQQRTGPDDMPIALKTMIETVFGNNVNALTPEQLSSRAILATTVKETMKVNNYVISTINGQSKQYLSVDGLFSDDANDRRNFPIEYLNRLQPSGMPPHELNLKIGTVIMLIRNLDPEHGLSNGTRLIVVEMHPNAIVARIISESNRGNIHFLCRMDLANDDATLPFKLTRQQFPVIPAFAMTINKSQGQTIERVGIYLNDVVFSHGQLYVAMSRCRDKRNISVYIKDQGTRQGRLLRDQRVFTKNVVYREVFRHGELQPILPMLADIDPELAEIVQQEIEQDILDEAMLNINQDNIIPDSALHNEYDNEPDSYIDLAQYLNVQIIEEDSDDEDLLDFDFGGFNFET